MHYIYIYIDQSTKKYSHVDLIHMVGGADLERGANVAGKNNFRLIII